MITIKQKYNENVTLEFIYTEIFDKIWLHYGLTHEDRKKLEDEIKQFEETTGVEVKLSGLPYIRTVLSARIAHEMRYFLAASIILSANYLYLNLDLNKINNTDSDSFKEE